MIIIIVINDYLVELMSQPNCHPDVSMESSQWIDYIINILYK